MKRETSATWVARFAKSDIPAGQVLSIPETAQLDLFQHRTVLQSVDTPHGPIKAGQRHREFPHGAPSPDPHASDPLTTVLPAAASRGCRDFEHEEAFLWVWRSSCRWSACC